MSRRNRTAVRRGAAGEPGAREDVTPIRPPGTVADHQNRLDPEEIPQRQALPWWADAPQAEWRL